eukprot:6381776-Alexandrium_andersonii.AAC.1
MEPAMRAACASFMGLRNDSTQTARIAASTVSTSCVGGLPGQLPQSSPQSPRLPSTNSMQG